MNECRAHVWQRVGAGKPDFEGDGTLMNQQTEAIAKAAAFRGGGFEKGGARRLVDGVIDAVRRDEEIGRDHGRVARFESEGGGLDDQVRIVAVGAQVDVVESEEADFGFGRDFFEAARERNEFVFAAIHEGEDAGFGEGALGGDGLSGAAAGTEDDAMCGGEFEGEFFADRHFKSRSIGIEAMGAAILKKDGVDGAEGDGRRIDKRAGFDGLQLVRDGDVASDESSFREFIKGAGDISGDDFEADVARIDPDCIEGRLVELWRGGVSHRIAENRESRGFFRKQRLIEVLQCEDGLHRFNGWG